MTIHPLSILLKGLPLKQTMITKLIYLLARLLSDIPVSLTPGNLDDLYWKYAQWMIKWFSYYVCYPGINLATSLPIIFSKIAYKAKR